MPPVLIRRLKRRTVVLVGLGIAVIAILVTVVHRTNLTAQTSATTIARALLRLHQENRPAVFSSNIVVQVDPLLAGGAPVHKLPAPLEQRNPLTCIITRSNVDVRCSLSRYMFQTNISDRWVLEQDAHDVKKWSLFEVHGFWGFRGPITTISE